MRLIVFSLASLATIALTATAGAFAGAQLLEGKLSPFVVDIHHAVPVEISAPVELDNGDVITVTAPITFNVDLRVSVDGQGIAAVVTKSEPEIEVINIEGDAQNNLIDSLGIPYTVEIDSPDFALVEWTTYMDSSDRLNVTGEVSMSAEAKPFVDVRAEIRLYDDNNNLISVHEIVNIGTRLQPSGYARFDEIIGFITPGDISHYTVRFRVQREAETVIDETAEESIEEGIDTANLQNLGWRIVKQENLGDHFNWDINYSFTTSGQFIRLHFEIENLGNAPADLYGADEVAAVLIDERGRQFTEMEYQYQFSDICFYLKINPGLTGSCVMVFDVPEDVGELTLRLSKDGDSLETPIGAY